MESSVRVPGYKQTHRLHDQVWLGFSEKDKRQKVVMKFCEHNDLGESFALQCAEHPCVIPLLDEVKLSDSSSVLVFPHVELHHPSSSWPIPISTSQDVAAYFSPLLQALSSCHRRQIIHMDVKPANYLFGKRSYLIDFEHAKLLEFGTVISGGKGSGTTHYSSPESFVAERKLTSSTDMWSVGIMALELVKQAVLFSNVKREKIPEAITALAVSMSREDTRQKLTEELPNPTLLTDWVWELIHGCLCLDPTKRLTASEALRLLPSASASGNEAVGSAAPVGCEKVVSPCCETVESETAYASACAPSV